MTKLAIGPPTLKTIEKARDISYLLTLELYCRFEDCPAREIVLRVKDHDNVFVARVKRDGLLCPACGKSIHVHWVRTCAAQDEEEAREARCSVNVQMFIRDLKRNDPETPLIVELSKYDDDRLPPTPDGWFGAGAPVQRRQFLRGGGQ